MSSDAGMTRPPHLTIERVTAAVEALLPSFRDVLEGLHNEPRGIPFHEMLFLRVRRADVPVQFCTFCLVSYC